MCKPCYQTKVKAFLDYPWQEDSEIEFVALLNQNRDSMARDLSGSKDYLRRMSIENGKAKLVIFVDSYKESAEKPMHLDGTVIVDVATCKMLRFEGKATDMPAMGQGMTISAAQFTIQHK